MTLQKKVIIITGASEGTGKAIASLFNESGASLILADSVEPDFGEKNAVFLKYDPLDISQHQKLVETAVKEFGQLDGIVNAMSACVSKKVAKLDLKVWDFLMDYNFKSLFFLLQAVARQIIAQGTKGTIVNLVTLAALSGTESVSAFSASQAASLNLINTLGIELAENNIRANTISLPYVDFSANKAGDVFMGKDPEKIKKMAYVFSPMMELIDQAQVARIARFLTSDNSEPITGQTINIIDDELTSIRNILTKKRLKA